MSSTGVLCPPFKTPEACRVPDASRDVPDTSRTCPVACPFGAIFGHGERGLLQLRLPVPPANGRDGLTGIKLSLPTTRLTATGSFSSRQICTSSYVILIPPQTPHTKQQAKNNGHGRLLGPARRRPMAALGGTYGQSPDAARRHR